VPFHCPLDSQTPVEIAADFTDACQDKQELATDFTAIDFSPADQMLESPSSSPLNRLNMWAQLELDLLLADGEADVQRRSKSYERALWGKSTGPPSFFASALVHIALLCLLAFLPATLVGGNPGYTGNVIAVRIVPQEELIPQDESPASIDSAASAPSRAKRVEKPREHKPAESPKQPTDVNETGSRPGKIVLTNMPATAEEHKEQKKPEPEEARNLTKNPEGDGPQDSVASIPSVASAERRFIPAAGHAGQAFESSVLSAIREAIFFPKRALEDRHHGEVVVAFTIKKDGAISEVSITRPSGFTILDQAAIRIIEKAAKKFPPIPTELNAETLNYIVPILFKKKRGS